MRTGVAELPLHQGRCPPWLYARMVQLAGLMAEAIVTEFSPEILLERLADPVWFQAFGAVLGFDWHSSGLTTVTTAALKEGLGPRQAELGVFLVGGKGRTSRQVPQDIVSIGERHGLAVSAAHLVEISRLVAKVDNTAVQDGYQLYHHTMAFTRSGQWAVVQQGMATVNARWARRYHWWSQAVEDPVVEPHQGIVGDRAATSQVLDLTAGASTAARTALVSLLGLGAPSQIQEALPYLKMPSGHQVPRSGYLDRLLYRLYERPPQDFSGLLLTPGMGPASLRALVMVAEMIYGVQASRRDPIRYSFAHGGKDGTPFPVSRRDYDQSLAVLKRALTKAKIGQMNEVQAFQRLARWEQEQRKDEVGDGTLV